MTPQPQQPDPVQGEQASEKAMNELRKRGIDCELPYTYLGEPDRFVIVGEWDRRFFRVPWVAVVTHKDGQLEVITGGTALTRFGARIRAFAAAEQVAKERGAIRV